MRHKGLWLPTALSVPVMLIGLWIGLAQGERVYRFLLDFKDDYSAARWAVIVGCRVASWAILVTVIVQTVLLVLSTRRPGLKPGVWIGLALLVSLVTFWLVVMLPTLALMKGMRPA